jgi:MHS family proline/betaine transporter-like MFS transporter
MFPGKGRYTGISIAYNISMALVVDFPQQKNIYFIHAFLSNMVIAY